MIRAALALLLLGTSASAEVPEVGVGAEITADSLMKMGEAELIALYKSRTPGPVPDGPAKGIANSEPGDHWGTFTREFFRGLWKGKTFDRKAMQIINRTPVGNTGTAAIVLGNGRIDGKPAILLDYAKSSNPLSRGVWDELRMIRPGLYLGIAYLRLPFHKTHRQWMYFGLEFETK